MAKALGKFHTQTPLSKDVTLFKKGMDLFLLPDLKKTVSIKKSCQLITISLTNSTSITVPLSNWVPSSTDCLLAMAFPSEEPEPVMRMLNPAFTNAAFACDGVIPIT